jgi:integrase
MRHSESCRSGWASSAIFTSSRRCSPRSEGGHKEVSEADERVRCSRELGHAVFRPRSWAELVDATSMSVPATNVEFFVSQPSGRVRRYDDNVDRAADGLESARTKDRRVAEKLLARRVHEVRNHRLGLARFVGPSQRKIKVRDLLADLIDRMRVGGKKSVRTATSQVQHFLNEYGGWRAVDITSSTLGDYQQMRLGEGAARATVDRELEIVTRAFRVAFADGRLSAVPTAQRLQKLHENARQGFLKPEQFLALLDEIENQDFRDWLSWFWWTGMRNGETSSLTWDGLEDGEPPIITLFSENAKIGEARKIPVVGPLREIVERRIERRRDDCPLIFHSSAKSFKATQGGLPRRYYAVWKKACGTIGLPNLRVYDLRRSAIRNLIHAGVPELTAMKISGHRSRETFRRYAIEDPSEVAAAIERVGEYVTPRMKSRGRLIQFKRKTGTTRARRAK